MPILTYSFSKWTFRPSYSILPSCYNTLPVHLLLFTVSGSIRPW